MKYKVGDMFMFQSGTIGIIKEINNDFKVYIIEWSDIKRHTIPWRDSDIGRELNKGTLMEATPLMKALYET